MKYKQITVAQRCKIEILHKSNYTFSTIAEEIGCHKSTICRELKKHTTPNGYFADIAQIGYETNRSSCKAPKKLLKKIWYSEYVIEYIKKGWSPEQIAGRLKFEKSELVISAEAIYQFVYKDPFCIKMKLYQYLRRGKRRRTKWHSRSSQSERMKNKVSIEFRPDISDRKEFGHWESDSIVSNGRKAFIITNVERKTKYTIAKKQDDHTALTTGKTITDLLSNTVVRSITVDNGTEFSDHEVITATLNAQVYFCHPYSSWERGTNENTNGLIRRYIPKRENFKNLENNELDSIIEELNNRPRKCLGYLKPVEVYKNELLLYLNNRCTWS